MIRVVAKNVVALAPMSPMDGNDIELVLEDDEMQPPIEEGRVKIEYVPDGSRLIVEVLDTSRHDLTVEVVVRP